MLRYLVVLFVGLPLIDLFLLVKIADIIGFIETVLLVIFTGMIGASLIKSEGIGVLRRLQNAVYLDEVGQAVVEGALLVGGGIFLLSPGVITDLCGFVLVFSGTRQHLAVRLRDYIQNANSVTVDVQYM
jgi:UPF0716 protein FxsA